MDTKKLRQKILDFAIRGKLVPQDSNDEPATVLLERIRAEKELLIKEGKIKRSMKIDTDDEEEAPFEIPESWKWTCLGEITDYGNCENVDVKNIPNDGWTLELEDLEKESAKVLQRLTKNEREIKGVRHAFHKGDVLYSKLRTYLNKVLVASEDGFCTTEIIPISCFSKVLPEYLNYVLRSKFFVDYTIQCGYGVKMPRLSTMDACKGLIPLPPYSEQKRIVEVIESWFQFIDYLEKEKTELEYIIAKFKTKILDLAIHGNLVPQEPNDEPAIELMKRINPKFEQCAKVQHVDQLPKGWVNAKLEDICQIVMGSSPSSEYLNTEKKGVEFHQGKLNFSDLYINLSETYTTCVTKLAPPNSLLLCVRAPVGIVNITTRPVCIGRGLCSLTPKAEMNLMFLFYALYTFQSYYEENATGTTFKAIGGEIVRQSVLPIPPVEEQKRIVTRIEELFGLLDEIKNNLDNN